MKTYTITVNGNAYEVTVEEGEASASAPAAAPAAAPKAAPKAAPAPASAPAPAPAATGAGSVKVAASVPGKVLSVLAKVGDSVTKGQDIITLEAMKMEVSIVAPQDGTVASIDVAVGQQVEAGDILASLN